MSNRIGFLLTIILIFAVLFLIGMVAVIVLFAKRAKNTSQPPVQRVDATQPPLTRAVIAETKPQEEPPPFSPVQVDAVQPPLDRAVIAEAEPQQEPPAFLPLANDAAQPPPAKAVIAETQPQAMPPSYSPPPVIPPRQQQRVPVKKTNIAAVIAGLLALCLFVSFSVNIAFLLYTANLNSKVTAVSAAMKSNNEEIDRLIAESDNWKAQCEELELSLYSAAYESDELRRVIEYYTSCIAFVNEYDEYWQLYHTAWCDDLEQDFYIYAVKEAEMMFCSPCPVCHTSESLDSFILD